MGTYILGIVCGAVIMYYLWDNNLNKRNVDR
jgi:hypothetical protein